MAHRTPEYLDDPLPTQLGPNMPELLGGAAAILVGVVLNALAGGISGQWRILVVILPPTLLMLAVCALYQGRTERYPRQVWGYTIRQAGLYARKAIDDAVHLTTVAIARTRERARKGQGS